MVPMPSPIGHVLAGVAVALAADAVSPSLRRRVDVRTGIVTLAALAALPDLDLMVAASHRSFSHSVGSVILVTIIAAVVTGWVTGRRSLGIGALCGVAWASHLLLDWLGVDPNPPSGIKALWPFSDDWFISSLQVFPGTERRQLFSAAAFATNCYAVAIEMAVLAPVVAALWLLRSRRRGKSHAAFEQDRPIGQSGGDHA
jgi:inner membrane protein